MLVLGDTHARSVAGSSEREGQEFEYVRHGTVNVLMFLMVHSGRMKSACPQVKVRRTTFKNLICSLAGRRVRCWRDSGGSGENAAVFPRRPTEVVPTGWLAFRELMGGSSGGLTSRSLAFAK